MILTPNMNMNLPIVDETLGPDWADELNTALDSVVDSHDHSSGKGVKVTPSGLNINADLPFTGNNATLLRTTRYSAQTATLGNAADLNCVYSVNGNLYWNSNTGDAVQITDGAGLNFSSLGTIGGDFGQPGVQAAVTYSDSTKTFSFTRSAGAGAIIIGSTLKVANVALASQAIGITANAAANAYTITLADAAPIDDQSLVVLDIDGQLAYTTTINANITQFGNWNYIGTPTVSGDITRTGTETGGTYVGSNFTTPALTNPTISGTLTSGPYTLSGTVTGGTYATATLSGVTTNSGTIVGGVVLDPTITAAVHTGNTTGTGIVPLGAILATASNLTGAYNCSATTSADSNGFVQCNGQTISDVLSPMNGVVVPNINNSVFLMGSTTSGTTGGSNSTTLTTTQLPAHTHGSGSYTTSVGVTGGTASLTGTTTFASNGHTHTLSHTHTMQNHTHNFAHVHQWAYTELSANLYTMSTQSPSTTTFTSSGTFWLLAQTGFYANVTTQPNYIRSNIGNAYTAGVLSPPSGSGASASTGAPSNNTTSDANTTTTDANSGSASVGISSTAASMTGSNSVTGTSTSSGSGSAYDSRPSYISTKYIIRIK